jgi:hypothetical protein
VKNVVTITCGPNVRDCAKSCEICCPFPGVEAGIAVFDVVSRIKEQKQWRANQQAAGRRFGSSNLPILN